MCVKQRRTPSTDEDGDSDDARVSSAAGQLILDVRAISPIHKTFPHKAKHIFLKNWTPLEQFMTVRKTHSQATSFYSQLTLASTR